jgi:HK97 family phage prohead protease
VKQYRQEGNDYLDLIVKGYASTNDSDRYDEYFISGAWSGAIKHFMSTNPVLLLDHNQEVKHIVGRVIELKEDSIGLYFEANITNSESAKDLRFKLVEGLVRSVSVGGRWVYDGQAIIKVLDLFEISLVAVPANPMALISAKSFENDNINKSQLIRII